MIKTVLLLFVVAVASHPTFIDCELKATQGGAGAPAVENIMTTTANVMGTPPVAATGLTFPTEVEAGATLDLTFPASVGRGFVHVSSGKLAKLDNFDQPCENMIRSETTGTLNDATVQFTAPSAAGDVTLSIAYAENYGAVSRFSQTITVMASTSGGSGSDSSTGGSDSPGSDSTGSDSPGSDSTGSDSPGSDSTGSDSPDSDSPGSGSTGSGDNSAAVAPKLGLATLAASLSFLL